MSRVLRSWPVLVEEAHRATPFEIFFGTALYLVGRFLFLRLTVRTSPGQLVGIGVTLLLVPVAGFVPAQVAMGLLAAFLATLALYERLTLTALVD
ncbi:hypothetical protein EAD89_00325 [Micromonospora sp. BL4]|uniref:hypothetical protein n=1 Tax=Micromonospora sp. BL4 TaxID=2478710 RepID=UPI000EF568F6|nr:hypothetical protein [Micromonospora sp. BL4]RLP96105.1 hypothetical protein EAD89_00325 [Micromonospora sp. BL4]